LIDPSSPRATPRSPLRYDKKIFDLAVLGMQVPALLIEVSATRTRRHKEKLIADYAGNFGVDGWFENGVKFGEQR
jgi:hypothetical protein